MRICFGFPVSSFGFFGVGARLFGLLISLLYGASALAQDVKTLAEAEGKLVFYAGFNANDSKTLIDGFKQLHPKIEGTFYRATDAQLMERMLTEARAGRQEHVRGLYRRLLASQPPQIFVYLYERSRAPLDGRRPSAEIQELTELSWRCVNGKCDETHMDDHRRKGRAQQLQMVSVALRPARDGSGP